MKLSDKMPLWIKKKSNRPNISNEEIIKNIQGKLKDKDILQTEKRIYPALGENCPKPGVFIIVKLVLSALLLAASFIWEFPYTTESGIRLAAALIAGYDIIISAVRDLSQKEYLRENTLIVSAAVISFCIGRETEAVLAPIIFHIACLMRDYVLYRTKKALCGVMEAEMDVSDSGFSEGDIITIGAKMTVPADCEVEDGTGYADFSFITGDNSLKSVSKGDFLPAGCLCVDGELNAKVKNAPENSLYKRISDTLISGFGAMTDTEKAWYSASKLTVPLLLTFSAVLLLILPLVFKFSMEEAFRRVAAIIAVTSPAGILLAFPISFFAGMVEARTHGAAVKDAQILEKAASIKTVVFNKAGTLTEKNYSVTDIKTDKMDPATFLKVAAHAEANSSSNVAKAILAAYGGEITKPLVTDFVEYKGKGVSVSVDDIQIILGNSEFLSEREIAIPDGFYDGSVVHMAVNGIYAGRITLSETVTRDASDAIHRLPSFGVDRIAMVSGDSRERDRLVATELAIEEYYAECTPEEKALRIRNLKERLALRGTLAYVVNAETSGEGLEEADIGIKINGLACGSGFPDADVVIMNNSPVSVASVIHAAHITKSYISIGALGCFFVKAVLMLMAAFGIAPLWFTLIIDNCASAAFIVNCLNLLKNSKQSR